MASFAINGEKYTPFAVLVRIIALFAVLIAVGEILRQNLTKLKTESTFLLMWKNDN
nr:MAG TPA: hypothetical protein [Caudoviricetes sp.]